jgi:translation initiation factor eIF-2B subunit epsilon
MSPNHNPNNDNENKHNQKLQAVLLADSFLTTFHPITIDKSTPKVLCPLNNVTMIDYAIEYLSGTGVEELYIFVVHGGDAIENYIHERQTLLTSSRSSMQIYIVRDSSVCDAGGALRELYNKNLIKSDPFILMSGDVVTNADIGPVMKEHKERHKRDSSAIMTVLLKRVGGWHVDNVNENENDIGSSKQKCYVSPLQPLNEDLTIALAHPNTTTTASVTNSNNNPNTHSRIFLYDTNPNSTTTNLPTSFFTSTPSITLYNNLLDCGIYICSPDVLAKFSDEWDYLHIQTFISNSVAEEEEGLQTKIYANILSSSEYASKIHDYRTYHTTSSDLLKRWCYPIVPDNLPCGYEQKVRYSIERHNHHQIMYIEQKGKTKLGRNVTIQGPGMVGSHTKIKNDCHIQETVIGNGCYIGQNVILNRCHLWDGVIVEDGANVTDSILSHGCIVKKNAVVKKGCVIGKNCIIGENIVLPDNTRITTHIGSGSRNGNGFGGQTNYDDSFDDDFDDSDDDANNQNEDFGNSYESTDHTVVGQDGIGRVWTPKSNTNDGDDYYDEEEDENEHEDFWNAHEQMKAQSIGYDPTMLLQKRMKKQIQDDVLFDVEHGFNEDEDMSSGYNNTNSNNAAMSSSNNFNEDGLLIIGRQADVDVVKELKLICLDYDFTSPIENLRIELNSFKFSQNATFSDCVSGAMMAIVERLKLTDDISAAKLVSSFKSELQKWSELLEKLCFGLEEEVSVIKTMEKLATSGGTIGNILSREPSFRFMLQTLHGEEIISDEAVLSWANMRREESKDTLVGKLFNQKHTQEFLEWIEEESSDDDSDGDDSSSSSNED